MIVDASAMVAIMLDEPEARALADLLEAAGAAGEDFARTDISAA